MSSIETMVKLQYISKYVFTAKMESKIFVQHYLLLSRVSLFMKREEVPGCPLAEKVYCKMSVVRSDYAISIMQINARSRSPTGN